MILTPTGWLILVGALTLILSAMIGSVNEWVYNSPDEKTVIKRMFISMGLCILLAIIAAVLAH